MHNTHATEGTSILKELAQNADDARASRIAFVNDRRSFAAGERAACHHADSAARGQRQG